MYHVLLAVDDDETRAVEQAETVADLPEAASAVKVTVYHVFTDNPSGASATQVRSVREVTDYLEEAGIETEVGEESGDPAAEIVEAADELDADVICIGGRKRSPTGKALFGSVTQSVILSTDAPVLVAEER